MKTMKENIVTIFEQLQEYGKAARKFKDENPEKGAPSILNEDIKSCGTRILAAMKEVSQELTAKDGPMNGLCCPVDLDPKTGLGVGRAKDSNSFYLTWAMGAPVVEGVTLSCYVAMNFILCGQRTNESKINIGCGFWVNTPSNGKYSERIKAIGSKQFLEFRHKFNYPLQDGKFVKNDCPLDKDLVSCMVIDVPAPADDGKFSFDDAGVRKIIEALKDARQTCEIVSKWADEFSRKDIMDLLEANYQIILTGAPGTGKTYLAENLIAPCFVKTDIAGDTSSTRIFKVQFHPGYDYSDFVIGLKPVLVDAEGRKCEAPMEGKKVSVTFEWTEGVFLDIVKKAKSEYDDAKKNGYSPKKYVLIIDEINRADLSRVFGELFSQLESGYRYRLTKAPGEELEKEIREQENKGILLPNNKRLVVPENLYIIGTMNDIDRSVESIDFAMRRRFGWYEVSSESSQAILARVDGPNSPLIEAMNQLNGEIEKVKGLGKEYHLGGAIFAKIAQYDEKLPNQDRYDLLWRNHIANTLKDYLRGNPKAKEIYDSLKNIYDKCVTTPRKQMNGEEENDEPATTTHTDGD